MKKFFNDKVNQNIEKPVQENKTIDKEVVHNVEPTTKPQFTKNANSIREEKKSSDGSFKIFIINFILFAFIIIMGLQFYVVSLYDFDDSINDIYQNTSFNYQFNHNYESNNSFDNANNYVTFENIKVQYLLEEGTLTNSGSDYAFYTFKESDEYIELKISISENGFYNILKENSETKEITYVDLLQNNSNMQIVANYLIENSIENEVDFIQSFTTGIDTSFVSNKDEICDNYAISYLIDNYLESGALTTFTGNNIGYIVKIDSQNIKIVVIKDNTNYTFEITGDYDFDTTKSIYDVVNSIIIN